jgi:hypothetical protein
VLKSQLTTTGFPPVEEQWLHALMADVDFREAATRRDSIVIACKHLRSVENREGMCFQAIGCLFGFGPVQIPKTKPDNVPGTLRPAPI